MEEKKITVKKLIQTGKELRAQAKEYERKLSTITDPSERKQVARLMNNLFTKAKQTLNEAKHQRVFNMSTEREWNSSMAELKEIEEEQKSEIKERQD